MFVEEKNTEELKKSSFSVCVLGKIPGGLDRHTGWDNYGKEMI